MEAFVEVESQDLYDKDKVSNPYNAYFHRTTSSCRMVYYEPHPEKGLIKRFVMVSFSRRDIVPVRCVATFQKIASGYGETLKYDPNPVYTNGIYIYYDKAYDGPVTVLDMNSAYLYALSQPLADWTTREECSMDEVISKKYDYYSFENGINREIFHKDDQLAMMAAYCWFGVRIYGFKSRLFYQRTCQELYRLKTTVNAEKYKNVANIAIGCMHKRSGKQNNATLAASLYAWFSWHIDGLVKRFQEKGYKVIMVTTDSIKVAGGYNPADGLVTLGGGLGEWKVEYTGDATYISEGHYTESREKWKGKPRYMVDGYERCTFIEKIEEEKEVIIKYAVV